jgi:hypothetical protein
MRLLFVMVEEESAKEVLNTLLPKILPKDVHHIITCYEGKNDLQKSIPTKLRAWNVPNTKFLILHDQDSADCVKLKEMLQSMCDEHRSGVLVRIACIELEAWYFGDLYAVSKAYSRNLLTLSYKKKYRIPDKIHNPKDELKKLIPQHQQVIGAKRIAPFMNIERNTSQSFNMFVSGLKKLFN